MAYAMVTIYGMNSKVGNISFNDPNNEYGFTKPYSDKTAELIDEEVRKQIELCYEKTKELLISKREKLEEVAKLLLQKEIIFQHDLEIVLGKRPFDYKHKELDEMNAAKTAENEKVIPENEEQKIEKPLNEIV